MHDSSSLVWRSFHPTAGAAVRADCTGNELVPPAGQLVLRAGAGGGTLGRRAVDHGGVFRVSRDHDAQGACVARGGATQGRRLSGPDVIRPGVDDVVASLELHRRTCWDAMAVRSAQVNGCDTLLFENLKDGVSVGQVVVENPVRRRLGA